MCIVKPFLKWARNKWQLIKQTDILLPATLKNGEIETHIEPFFDG